MTLLSPQTKRIIQEELLAKAATIKKIDSFHLFVDLFISKTKQFSEDDKLNLLFQICQITPGFPGDKPPYLEKNDSVFFARRLLDYKKSNNLSKKIVVVSLGISDGARMYQAALCAKVLGIDIRLIGIDYSSEYLKQASILFPDQEFIFLDLFDLKKGNAVFEKLVGTVDFIDISFLLHEIFSFVQPNYLNKIKSSEGKEKVKILIQSCYELLKKNGEIIIKDGYILNDAKTMITVKFSNTYRRAYELLRKEYRPMKLPSMEPDGKLHIKRQELAAALDKMTFFLHLRRRNVTPERIEREMREQLCFLTEKEFRNLLKKANFTIAYVNKFNQKVYEEHQLANVVILEGPNEMPSPYITIVGVK